MNISDCRAFSLSGTVTGSRIKTTCDLMKLADFVHYQIHDNFYVWTDAKDKEAEIDVHQNLTVLSRLAFALKVACEIS